MKAAKIGGACLLGVAVLGGLLAVFMFLDPLEGQGRVESLVPGLFFGTVALVPGLALFLWARGRERAEARVERAVGLVRSHDRFTTVELAGKLDLPFDAAEALILELAQRPDLDLLFHRPDQSWMHGARLRVKHAVVTKCPSCGAGVGSQVVFVGESVACPYCHSPLRATETHLPQGPVRPFPARPDEVPD